VGVGIGAGVGVGVGVRGGSKLQPPIGERRIGEGSVQLTSCMFYKERLNKTLNIKMDLFNLVIARRSTVLSLPLS
jgi:hypothetical protein